MPLKCYRIDLGTLRIRQHGSMLPHILSQLLPVPFSDLQSTKSVKEPSSVSFFLSHITPLFFFIVTTSSILIFAASAVTIFISPVPKEEVDNPNYAMLIPLFLLGVGYSVYAAALWGCIPYTVAPKLIGSAFGLTTAIQNIGLTISPLIGSALLNTEKEDGYFWYLIYFCFLSAIGFCLNVWLYIDDLKNRGGILDKVDRGEDDEPQDLLTSPTVAQRKKAEEEIEEYANKDGLTDEE